MDWLRETWGYLLAGGAVLASAVAVLRATFAAERDRQALKQVQLEREKLTLEIARLRNSPEALTERRQLYDRLRSVLATITGDTKVRQSQIAELHEVWHDAAFLFSPGIVGAIQSLIQAAVKLHVTGRILERGPQRMSDSEWQLAVNEDHEALTTITSFQRDMIALFKPYLAH